MQNLPPATETIRAAHNLAIEHDAHRWRLYNGARQPGQPDSQIALLDARREQIDCAPAFAKARQLPHTVLDPANIARVIVGWAPESRNWHLGLLLAAQPESDYKPRWCGLASWPAGPADAHQQAATSAGKSLARVINRPFHMIPAETAPPLAEGDTEPVEITRPVEAPPPQAQPAATPVPDVERVPVKAPPFTFERWTMQRIPSGLVWRRRARWVWGTLGRLAGYGVLVALYLLLSIGVQTSGLAAVEPAWLPWLGVAIAVLLAGLAVRQFWLLWTATDTIIDTAKGVVRARRRFTGRTRWQLTFDNVAYALLSQTPARPRGLKRHGEYTPVVQDVWLHLSDGERFYPIAALREVEGQSQQWDIVRQRQKITGRRRLRLAHYDSPAHHAARVMAETIGTELWQDIR